MDNQEQRSILAYQMVENDIITFEDFELIIRGLHSYKVLKIEPQPEENAVLVTLDYIANIKNVRGKLGSLPATVSKLNPNLPVSEIGKYNKFKEMFGLGSTVEPEESQAPGKSKKRKYKESSGYRV